MFMFMIRLNFEHPVVEPKVVVKAQTLYTVPS